MFLQRWGWGDSSRGGHEKTGAGKTPRRQVVQNFYLAQLIEGGEELLVVGLLRRGGGDLLVDDLPLFIEEVGLPPGEAPRRQVVQNFYLAQLIEGGEELLVVGLLRRGGGDLLVDDLPLFIEEDDRAVAEAALVLQAVGLDGALPEEIAEEGEPDSGVLGPGGVGEGATLMPRTWQFARSKRSAWAE